MIGTRDWSERTHGSMTAGERVAHAASSVAVLTTAMPGAIRFRWSKSPPELDLDATPPPSDLVRAATTWAEEIHEPWLLRHSLRTWAFARLVGQLDELAIEPEPLFLACLLHDVGLTDAQWPSDACGCFAVHGAHVSEEKLRELGASPLLASEVADAIGMHLNAKVGSESGTTAHLLQQGAGLDVVGLRASDLGRPAVSQVVRQQDRHGFPRQLIEVLRTDVRERPDARMANFVRCGMTIAIRANPINGLTA